MKLLLPLLILIFSSLASAKYIAVPIDTIIESTIEEALYHQENGQLHGYLTTESCMYKSSAGVIVFKNYCLPKKDYPARSFTIVSKEFGVIDLYEERLGKITKKDITIREFPESVQNYFSKRLDSYSFDDLNIFFKSQYQEYGPACWSTNYSYSQGKPTVDCYKVNINDYSHWRTESQILVNSTDDWDEIFSLVKNNLR